MSAHAAARAARRERIGAEHPNRGRAPPSARRPRSGRARLRPSAGRRQEGSGGHAPAEPQPMGGLVGRGSQRAARRRGGAAASAARCLLYGNPPGPAPLGLQPDRGDRRASAPNDTPASCARPAREINTGNYHNSSLPGKDSNLPTSRVGRLFHWFIHNYMSDTENII